MSDAAAIKDIAEAVLSSEPAEPEREGRAHGPLSSDGKGRLWDHDVTLPGLVVGTPRYIAPELWSLEPATRRSDVYALGAILFELASGRRPHVAKNFATLGTAILSQDAPPLRTLAPHVDARLAAVIDRCLRRSPDERFASGVELSQALR